MVSILRLRGSARVMSRICSSPRFNGGLLSRKEGYGLGCSDVARLAHSKRVGVDIFSVRGSENRKQETGGAAGHGETEWGAAWE